MKRSTFRFAVNAVLDVVLLLVCILHLPSVFHRPAAPFDVANDEHGVLVTRILDLQACGGIQPGDYLLSAEGIAIPTAEAVEFLADLGTIGMRVRGLIERQGTVEPVTVTLIPFYPSPRFLIISFIVGFIVWLTAVFILWNAPPGPAATTLHWTMIAFAVTILITLGRVSTDSWMSYVDRVLFFVAYMGVVALIFYFSLLYPAPKKRWMRILTAATFVPAALLIGGMSYYHISDLKAATLEHFSSFQLLFDLFHVSLFVYFGATVFNIAHSFAVAVTSEERKRLQWIIWGLCIGIIPFLFLVVLPQILFSQYFIPEEYATIFFLAIPFSFAISFLRYHFLDIEVLINRSIVYFILSLFVVVGFGLIFLLMSTAFGRETAFEEYILTVVIALGISLTFIPVRDRLQHLVDETLFAARANFRAAVRDIAGELHRSYTSDMVYQSLVQRLYNLIPCRSVAAYVLEGHSLHLRAVAGDGAPQLIGVSAEMRAGLGHMALHSLPEATVPPRTLSRVAEEWLRQSGYSVCCSLKNESVMGVVTLAQRAKGDRFREEELDLLSTACSHASEILERFVFQERAFLEQEEKKRVQELSDMKSYFVSSVSHELRMPLTSIRMFAETLRLGRTANAKQRREYLDIIEGESGRLNRLIDNVLDFSRVERGIKEYKFAPTNLRTVIRNAVASLNYEFRKAHARLKTTIAPRLPEVKGDADALEEVLMNLLSNALKYSVERKSVTVAARPQRGFVVLDVSDKGIGIPADQLPHVFDRFYRVRDPRSAQVGGVGLGLPLVRHIVEAHAGTIAIRSSVGKGTTVTVKLPVSNENHPARRR